MKLDFSTTPESRRYKSTNKSFTNFTDQLTLSAAWSGHVTKFVNFYPTLNYKIPTMQKFAQTLLWNIHQFHSL